MKKIGKILSYDGYTGYIIDDDGVKYIFTNNDLKDKNITVKNTVKFKPEIFETLEIKEYTARFISKITLNKNVN